MSTARFFAWVNAIAAVVATMNGLSAVIDGNVSAALGWFVAAMSTAVLAARRFDDAHIAEHQTLTRTWRYGELADEHRVDADGVQSGTFYGTSR